jgi:predicted RNA-binding Zn ribbon-like protein
MISPKSMAELRPLRGEPISLDLVNTEWVDAGSRRDLLETLAGVRDWLGEHDMVVPEKNLRPIQAALIETRATLRLLLEGRDGAQARERLNEVLARGRIKQRLGNEGPVAAPEVPDVWRAAWEAAFDYLELLRHWPASRIKACAHPDCILYFLDTSKNGTRRWCDMRTCGNRFRVQQHYMRQKKREP